MGNEAGSIKISMLLSLAQFDAAIKSAQAKLTAFQKSAIGISKNFEKVGKSLSSVGKNMTLKVTAPLSLLGYAAFNAAVDFETAFTGVTKTVNGTAEQISALRQGIIDMSKEIPASTTEISAVAEAAGQLGIQTPNILSFTRVMIDLGNTTNLSANDAATALARLANIMQTDQSKFENMGSAIVGLGNNFATTEAEITDMALNLAGAGKQIGLSEADVLGFSTALSSVGIEAEKGGSAFSKLFIGLQKAIEKGGPELVKFASVAGMSASEFAKAFKEKPAQAISAFIKGLGQIREKGGSTIQTLEALDITEVRMRDSILRLAGAGDLLSNAIQQGNTDWQQNTALTNEANKRYETAASMLGVAKNKLVDLGRQFGEVMVPVVTAFVAKLQGLVSWFSSLSEGTKKTILVVAGLAAAIGPLILIAGQVASAIGAIIPVMVALTGPVGLAVLAIGALAAAFIYLVNSKNSADLAFDDVKKSIGDISKLSKEELQSAKEVTSERRKQAELAIAQLETEKEAANNLTVAQGKLEKITSLDRQISENKTLIASLDQKDQDINKEILKRRQSIYQTAENAENARKEREAIDKKAAEEKAKAEAKLKEEREAMMKAEAPEWLRSGTTFAKDPFGNIIEPLQSMPEDWKKNKDAMDDVLAGFGLLNNETAKAKSGFEELSQAQAESQEKMYRIADAAAELSTRVSQAISSGLTDMAEGLAELIGSGLNGAANLGKYVLGTLADMLSNLGRIAIETGVGLLAIKVAFESLNPAVAIAAGVALMAFSSFIRSKITEVPALAEGGLAYGPTMAMVGDNRGAKTNPEVIAPLSKLKDYMRNGSDKVEVTGQLTVKGTDLIAVLTKTNQKLRFV